MSELIYKESQSVFELAKDLYKNSDESARLFRDSRYVSKLLEDEPEKKDKLNKLALLSIPDDVFVFKVTMLLNPFLSIRIRSYCFDDYIKLGHEMLLSSPNPNPILSELVRYSLISEHMHTTLFDIEHPDIYKKAVEIEHMSKEDISLAYFNMAYFLSRESGIYYEGKKYKDVFNLTYHLCKEKENLDSIGESLAHSSLLKAYAQYSDEKDSLDIYFHLNEEIDKADSALKDFLNRKKRFDDIEEKED